jgi:DNA-binding protein
MRRQLSYCFAKLNSRETITLSAYGKNIPKGIQMVEILKNKMGYLHQLNEFVTTIMPNNAKSKEGQQ